MHTRPPLIHSWSEMEISLKCHLPSKKGGR
uniref:Uncharacterized protein n=1 Tax=Anguilla anguilla TaxID=7936 RepID=A0A0E9PLK9_ANGAN